ncbi:MAG: diaminopimelate decarboxylase [Haloferacaceae archaeon]
MSPADGTGPPALDVDDWDAALLDRLAAEYGTPLYVTDLDRVRENVRRLADAFPDARRMYAAKANTGQAVMATVVDEGMRVECAAADEVTRAVEAGADPDRLQYTAVNPPDRDLDEMVALWERNPNLRVTAGAVDTLDRLAARGFAGDLLLRVNPGEVDGPHESFAVGKDAKFGIPYERAAEAARAVREAYPFDLVGLHAHGASGMSGELTHPQAARRLAAVAREAGGVDEIDVGGGFAVPYRPEEEPIDLDALAAETRAALDGLAVGLAIEPGRYVVGDASVLLTRVNTVKATPGPTVVGVDASFTTLMRPALLGSYHPIRNVTGPDRDPEPVTLGGPVCTSTDTFCQNRPIPRPEREDLLAFGVAGAYGVDLTSEFHSQPFVAEVALEAGDERVVRERRGVTDMLARERR